MSPERKFDVLLEKIGLLLHGQEFNSEQKKRLLETITPFIIK